VVGHGVDARHGTHSLTRTQSFNSRSHSITVTRTTTGEETLRVTGQLPNGFHVDKVMHEFRAALDDASSQLGNSFTHTFTYRHSLDSNVDDNIDGTPPRTTTPSTPHASHPSTSPSPQPASAPAPVPVTGDLDHTADDRRYQYHYKPHYQWADEHVPTSTLRSQLDRAAAASAASDTTATIDDELNDLAQTHHRQAPNKKPGTSKSLIEALSDFIAATPLSRMQQYFSYYGSVFRSKEREEELQLVRDEYYSVEYVTHLHLSCCSAPSSTDTLWPRNPGTIWQRFHSNN
jgi:hypothetical protein